MQIITPAQCRAARALLEWSQPELAARCGTHVQTISNFEKGTGSPSKTTLEKMAITFAISGLIFSGKNGVDKNDSMLTIFEGDDANRRYLDNLYNDTKDKEGSEILISGVSEVLPNDKNRPYIERHVNRLTEAGVSERILIREGDKHLIATKESYRFIPAQFHSSVPFQLYENKLAMIEWGPPNKIVVIENKNFAEAYRKLFNFAWEHAKPVT